MKADQLVLGVDGGGTKTAALLAAREATGDAAVLGRGKAGSANPNVVGIRGTCAVLADAIAEAFQQAGVVRGPVASACVALAGGGSDTVQAELHTWARDNQVAGRFLAVNDALPVLAAGTPAGWGMAVIAGTGSLVFGRDRSGNTARAGGWGHVFGDEGSGYSVAVAGMRAVARAADGTGPATLLTDSFCERFGVDNPRAIVDVVYRGPWDRAEVATLAEIVCGAAEQRDPVAQRIITRAAEALACGVSAVAGRLDFANGSYPLALAGGLLVNNQGLGNRFHDCLARLDVRSSQVSVVNEPALGAVRLAIDALAYRT